jgi:hypothetical protein
MTRFEADDEISRRRDCVLWPNPDLRWDTDAHCTIMRVEGVDIDDIGLAKFWDCWGLCSCLLDSLE